MVSTRRNIYNAGVDKKQQPPRQVQKKLRDKLETASRELEKAYDRVDKLESEKLDEGDGDSPIQDHFTELKRELDAVKQQRDELEQNFQHNFTQADRKALVWRESALCLKEECTASRRREVEKEQQVKDLEEQLTTLMQQLRTFEANMRTTTRYPVTAAPLTTDEIAHIRCSALRSVVTGDDLEAALQAFFI